MTQIAAKIREDLHAEDFSKDGEGSAKREAVGEHLRNASGHPSSRTGSGRQPLNVVICRIAGQTKSWLGTFGCSLKLGKQTDFLRKQAKASKDREITFIDLFGLFWERRNLLSLIMGLSTIAAMVYAVRTPPVYQAQVVMVPVSTDLEDGALPSLSGGLSSLASLAGLGGNRTGSIQQNLAILRSRALAERYIEEYAFAPHLFPDRWDAGSKSWEPKKGVLRTLKDLIAARAAKSTNSPTREEVYRRFKDVVTVKSEDVSGLVTVRVDWREPQLAAQIANSFVNEANEFIRARHVAEANQRLRFLSNELATTSLAEIQHSIYQLVAAETKRSMVANVRKEFAFKIIDPAVVPELRAWPSYKSLLAVGIIGGLLLGVGIVLLDTWLTGARHDREG